MRTHANILDQILNTPTQGSKTASVDIGDAFLDADTRSASRGKGAWANKTAAVEGDGALSEAFANISAKEAGVKTRKEATKFKTLQEAVKFAKELTPNPGTKLASSQIESAKAAGRRLARLLSKTAAQMQQDGASKVADYFNPEVVPAWAKQARADLTLLQKIKWDTTPSAKVASEGSEIVKEKQLTDAELEKYVKNLLNEGVTPRQVEEKLNKLAELQGFTKSLGTSYLQQHAGVIGLAYIEPNAYMNDCATTQDRLEAKLGGVRAKSVKQIKACAGCQHFSKNASEKRCSLYRLPVIASQAELLPIINNLTAGATNKKAALIQIANGDTTKAKQANETPFGRTQAKGVMLTPKTAKENKTASFTGTEILAMHNSGQSIEHIYSQGVKIAGPTEAKAAVGKFLNSGLKTAKAKVALTQIDCTKLGSKLGASNMIHGEAKCASCTYRKGMHCGFTGGTLVTFPGIGVEKMASTRVSSGAPVDGKNLMSEFDLVGTKKPNDIEMIEDFADVDLAGFSKLDL